MKVDCTDCIHFRSTPYEARIDGCFLAKNMPGRQKDAFLDEQQVPGNHEKINLRGDCPDFEARPREVSFWQRLFSA